MGSDYTSMQSSSGMWCGISTRSRKEWTSGLHARRGKINHGDIHDWRRNNSRLEDVLEDRSHPSPLLNRSSVENAPSVPPFYFHRARYPTSR